MVKRNKENDKEEDLESLSGVSDNSDLFHVEARATPGPRTVEDEDLAIIDSIVPHLHDYPLLPQDATGDGSQSFTDLQSGKRLPQVHCGFKKCGWFSRETVRFHFDMERLLYTHLYEKHRHNEMLKVPEDQWDDEEAIKNALEPEDEETPPQYLPRHMRALAYYTAAVCAKERAHVPIIGPSLDRRMIALLMRLCTLSSW